MGGKGVLAQGGSTGKGCGVPVAAALWRVLLFVRTGAQGLGMGCRRPGQLMCVNG